MRTKLASRTDLLFDFPEWAHSVVPLQLPAWEYVRVPLSEMPTCIANQPERLSKKLPLDHLPGFRLEAISVVFAIAAPERGN